MFGSKKMSVKITDFKNIHNEESYEGGYGAELSAEK